MYGKCLNHTRVCDGYPDCFDKTDESENLCNYTTTTQAPEGLNF